MYKPLVSIITITFNLLKNNRIDTFKQCLESVHNQSYDNIEHLVIDGGSTDGTKYLLTEYQQKGWINFISEPDKGIYDAMNKGILLSKGKYLAFLNSDDFYHNHSGVAKSIEALEKTEADFSYAPVHMIDEMGEKLSFYHPQMNPDPKTAFFSMPFCHQTMFFRKEKMLTEFMFDETFASAGDYDLVLRMILGNLKSVMVNKTFVTFRFTGVSSVNVEQSLREVSKLYLKNYSKLCNLNIEDCGLIYDRGYIGLPLELAVKLAVNRYFDFGAYTTEFEKLRKEILQLQQMLKEKEVELSKMHDNKYVMFAVRLTKILNNFKGRTQGNA